MIFNGYMLDKNIQDLVWDTGFCMGYIPIGIYIYIIYGYIIIYIYDHDYDDDHHHIISWI